MTRILLALSFGLSVLNLTLWSAQFLRRLSASPQRRTGPDPQRWFPCLGLSLALMTGPHLFAAPDTVVGACLVVALPVLAFALRDLRRIRRHQAQAGVN